MNALDNKISAFGDRALREGRMEAKMRPVRFVDDERHLVVVKNTADGSDVRDDSVVGRRSDHAQFDVRIFVERGLDLLRRNAGINAETLVKRREQIDRLQSADMHRVVDRFVAVAGQQDLVAAAGQCEDRRDQTDCAAVDQIPALVTVENARCQLHGILKDPLRIVQIVAAGDLRNVDFVGIDPLHEIKAALVAGHVHRVDVLIIVLVQIIQNFQIRFSYSILIFLQNRPAEPCRTVNQNLFVGRIFLIRCQLGELLGLDLVVGGLACGGCLRGGKRLGLIGDFVLQRSAQISGCRRVRRVRQIGFIFLKLLFNHLAGYRIHAGDRALTGHIEEFGGGGIVLPCGIDQTEMIFAVDHCVLEIQSPAEILFCCLEISLPVGDLSQIIVSRAAGFVHLQRFVGVFFGFLVIAGFHVEVGESREEIRAEILVFGFHIGHDGQCLVEITAFPAGDCEILLGIFAEQRDNLGIGYDLLKSGSALFIGAVLEEVKSVGDQRVHAFRIVICGVFVQLADEFGLPEETVEQIRGPADCCPQMRDVADNTVREENQNTPAERNLQNNTQYQKNCCNHQIGMFLDKVQIAFLL